MPVRPMTDEEAERIFGEGRVTFGHKRPQPSSESSTESESSEATAPDLQNLPVDPALAPMRETEARSQASTTEKPPASRD